MTTCRGDQLRCSPQRLSRTPDGRARVFGPLAASLTVQAAAIVVGLLLGLPLLAIVLVIVGIAIVAAVLSRRTVSSLVAGAGIRVAQPYGPGEQVRVFVPSLNSVQDAEIVRVGAANTTLLTAHGMVLVPNTQMLRGTADAS